MVRSPEVKLIEQDARDAPGSVLIGGAKNSLTHGCCMGTGARDRTDVRGIDAADGHRVQAALCAAREQGQRRASGPGLGGRWKDGSKRNVVRACRMRILGAPHIVIT